MKKVILLSVGLVFIALAAATNANAQGFRKGDWVVNANVSGLEFNRLSQNDNPRQPDEKLSVTDFDVTAQAGYFIFDKLAVNAVVSFNYEKWSYLDDSTSSFGFGAGVRYYPVGNLFAGVDYIGQTSGDSDFGSHGKVSVGYDWFLADNVFFEPAVFYSKKFAKNGSENFGLSLGLGVKF
ncbi:MAG: hypothetical protein LBV38_00005 [Alistipes sp.]|jgi:opacity protein-like surface antigen|nr:hypothetical protein [Alistipes sp.]